MQADWERFIEEGRRSYAFMVTRFNDLFEENHIIDFFIRYQHEIQPNLVQWLAAEYESGHLRQRENWKMYRDFYTITDGYLGYKHLFPYQDNWFQIVLVWDEEEQRAHMEAGLCGSDTDLEIGMSSG